MLPSNHISATNCLIYFGNLLFFFKVLLRKGKEIAKKNIAKINIEVSTKDSLVQPQRRRRTTGFVMLNVLKMY